MLMVGVNSRKLPAGHLTHLVQCLPGVHKVLGRSLGSQDYRCNPSTEEAEAGR